MDSFLPQHNGYDTQSSWYGTHTTCSAYSGAARTGVACDVVQLGVCTGQCLCAHSACSNWTAPTPGTTLHMLPAPANPELALHVVLSGTMCSLSPKLAVSGSMCSMYLRAGTAYGPLWPGQALCITVPALAGLGSTLYIPTHTMPHMMLWDPHTWTQSDSGGCYMQHMSWILHTVLVQLHHSSCGSAQTQEQHWELHRLQRQEFFFLYLYSL